MFLESLTLFHVSSFDILNWKATEISSFSLSLEFCVIFQHLLLKPLGHAFQLRGVGMFMAQIRFVACLIILALSAEAADTNRTGIASQNISRNNFTRKFGRGAEYHCPCNQ